jgi:hypothetical protein
MTELRSGQTYVSEVKAQVLEPVDVLVAGGGTAGVTAAPAAARAGSCDSGIEGNTGNVP